MRGTNVIPLDNRIMRQVGLGMADGQIGQADYWLCVVDGRALSPPGRGGGKQPPLVIALEHMRSACGWLIAVVEPQKSQGQVVVETYMSQGG